MTTTAVAVTFDEMTRLSEAVAASGLFGMKTPAQALALMAIAQAEGQHPALAARDYHVVQGRPVLKADAMLARFQAAGGRMKMIEYTDARVVAEFSHPQGGTIVVDWDLERAKWAGLAGKDNWRNYPRQMLRARVISEGVRTVFPGAVVGMLTPEEAIDIPAESAPAERDVTPPKPATGIAALQARIAELAPAPAMPPAEETEAMVLVADAEIGETAILARAEAAETQEEWDAVRDLVRGWPKDDQAPIKAKYKAWKSKQADAYAAASGA